MIHSSSVKPRIFPIDGDVASAEIDRLQEITANSSTNRERIKEVGRVGLVDWKIAIPSVTVSARQLEYGNLEFFRKLAGKGDSVSTIEWTDFKTKRFDIAAYKTDDSGSVLGTLFYPTLRTSGFTINIGSPDAIIERNFNFAGEDEIFWQNNNKYLIQKRLTIAAGSNQTVSLSDPVPVADPDKSGWFLYRVARVRSGVTTVLTHGGDWSYDGAGTLTINGTSNTGDVILVWYTAGSYVSGQSTFTQNDADPAGITGEACSIYLQAGNYVYRLQSVALEVNFDRYDVKEVGSREVVAYGIRNINTRATIGRVVETYTIEEILRGKAGVNYGKIDIREFSSNIDLIIRVYSDHNKGTFKLGYRLTDLAATGTDTGIPTDDYITKGCTLEGESGYVTTDIGLV